MELSLDIDRHPNVVWEVTRACALACDGCPAGAQRQRSVRELSTYDGYRTIDQIAALRPSRFVITGGDPLRREDLYEFVHHARQLGLDPAVELSATPMLTRGALERLRGSGLTSVAFALDDVAAAHHDARRGLAGVWRLTITAMGWAVEAGLEFEVNTLVDRANLQHLGALLTLVEKAGAAAWNLFVLVPAEPAKITEMITPLELEQLFAFAEGAGEEGMRIRIHDAPQHRRYRLQHMRPGCMGVATVFITHTGEVQPGPFVPISGGNVRTQSMATIYRHSEIFAALRDEPRLKGKCGRCEFRRPCGGSRARALTLTGDLFASDPLCAYEPGAARAH